MAGSHHDTGGAVIHLDGDQAIILLEFLSEMPPACAVAETLAERSVLNAVLGQLEKQLAAPFREDYADLVLAARDRLASNAQD